MSKGKIGVVGAGSWGTALADCLARNGHPVILWSHETEVASGIDSDKRNDAYLPGVDLIRPCAPRATCRRCWRAPKSSSPSARRSSSDP